MPQDTLVLHAAFLHHTAGMRIAYIVAGFNSIEANLIKKDSPAKARESMVS